MFTKPFSVLGRYPLKKKLKRNYIARIYDTYEYLRDKDDDFTQLYLGNDADFIFEGVKNHYGKKISILYSKPASSPDSGSTPVIDEATEPIPIFFEIGEHLYPTLYLLWKYEDMIPKLITNSEVSRHVMRGADLFLPGVFIPEEGIGELYVGQVRRVVVYDNPSSFAVGVITISNEYINDNGMRGKCFDAYHTFHDNLWMKGDRSSPNDGFTPTKIVTDISEIEEEQGDEYESEDETKDEISENIDVEEAEKVIKRDYALTPDDIDTILEDTLLESVAKRIGTEYVPMNISAFYTNFVTPYLPQGPFVVDLKKSNYKKLSKFLKSLAKAGVLKVKDTHGTTEVTSVCATAKRVKEFIENGTRIGGVMEKYAEAEPDDENLSNSMGEIDSIQELERSVEAIPEIGTSTAISIAYTPRTKSQLRVLILEKDEVSKESVDYSNRVYLSREEVKERLRIYCIENSLFESKGRGSLNLNDDLRYSIQQGGSGSVNGEAKSIPFIDYLKRMLERLDTVTILKNGPEVEIHAKKIIQIKVENIFGGNRHVTKVRGLEVFGSLVDFKKLRQTFSKKFACSCAINSTETKKSKGMEMIIQGDYADEIIEYLRTEIGIPAELFSVSKAKSKSKKKKRH